MLDAHSSSRILCRCFDICLECLLSKCDCSMTNQVLQEMCSSYTFLWEAKKDYVLYGEKSSQIHFAFQFSPHWTTNLFGSIVVSAFVSHINIPQCLVHSWEFPFFLSVLNKRERRKKLQQKWQNEKRHCNPGESFNRIFKSSI